MGHQHQIEANDNQLLGILADEMGMGMEVGPDIEGEMNAVNHEATDGDYNF